MTDIQMPRLTDQMEEGTIVAWLAQDGAQVTAGQEIVEIETDKATVAHASEVDGALQILAAVGDTVAVGDVIARVGGATGPGDEPARSNGHVEPGPSPVPVTAGTAPRQDEEPRATPLARRVAQVHGIDLGALRGTGPRNRITKADVLAASGVPAPPAPPEPAAPPPAAPAHHVVPLTRLQQVVARRMLEATTTVPHFQVQTEVEIDAALALRQALKDAAAEGAPAPSVNDLIVKACALRLPEHPLVNGSFVEGGYELHEHVHVGIAVAAQDGLLVTTIRDADVKSLGSIARDSRRLAALARDGEATPQDLTGATFTVSNLGMFGMTAITAVINPPQAAILGVGAARPTLMRSADGEVVDRHLLTLTLSGDHRILNGADGARFLLDVKQTLEAPMRLAL